VKVDIGLYVGVGSLEGLRAGATDSIYFANGQVDLLTDTFPVTCVVSFRGDFPAAASDCQ
jgi:hypothetical protein